LQDSIAASLSHLPKLCQPTLSGVINSIYKPFFPQSYNWKDYAPSNTGGLLEKDYGKYALESFKVAVQDLANGCWTLDTVTIGNDLGEFWIEDGNGFSMRVVRERLGGPVKGLRRILEWRNMIGKEEEW
jgi:hypothetical protein